MRGYGFGFAGSLKHEELWEDGNGFQPNREGPQHLGQTLILAYTAANPYKGRGWGPDLSDFVAVGKEDCKDCTSTKQVLNLQRIDVRIVSRLVVIEH